jgi:DNA-binding transcriptional ArsR family regulator
MLRLQFSASDLARVRLRATLGPLPETLLALRALRSARDPGPLADWRRRVLSRLPPAAAVARLLPPGWTAADVFALVGPSATVEQGLAALRRGPGAASAESGLAPAPLGPIPDNEPPGRAPAGRLLAGRVGSRPAGLDRLAPGLDRLAAVLAVSYDLGVAPHWPAMRAHLDAERATRARILADGGIDGLFATLHPALRWRPPVLELPMWPRLESGGVVECMLAGRGLDVVPSVFCRDVPEAYVPGDGGPGVLIYPVPDHATVLREPAGTAPAGTAPEGDVPDGLAGLVGPTRAAVLAALTGGSTTGEVARRLRISPAGASQHATVLRRAGLILSTRRGNSVLHTLTPLGTALLDGWLGG